MIAELSIIIVSYNQFSRTTGPCLQSLITVREPELEIIVVDNGSDQETVEGLKRAADRDGRIRLLLHPENRGYARGNNDGVELAAAEYILLLNSDTLISGDGLALLVRHLAEAQEPCLVGPVTNAAGNEQQIFIREGSEVPSILTQGDRWCSHAAGSVFETDQLSFFCVAMARDTYRALEGLDPVFGLGFYEDADFCRRAAKQGIALQVLEECFVYHQGSASFSRIPDAVKKLLAKNRQLYRARHGRDEGLHVRWKNVRVLEHYLSRLETTGICPCYLFENRLARGRQLVPNSPLKKLVYAYRLGSLEKKIARSLLNAGDYPVTQGDSDNLEL